METATGKFGLETTRNGNKQRIEYSRNMQDHQKESKRGQKEIQPRYHTRNEESEESPTNAEARPRQTDHTPGQTG